MKLHAGTNVIEKSGNFEESKFSIEASSKAFFILSDGLYSNKILAVIRELSTNAYDSHVDAGKANVPFDVHIPTALTPVFFIRDYGTSMNHENCMQLYTTYFRSTRNNSNDAVGCLGLGSKAPFAYADSFTVEAYLDGTKRVYNAYKNEDGSPVFSLMDESPTTEQNGIKVSIQVSSHDIHRFHHEAEKVYEFFNTKPNFLGEKITFDNPTKVLAGSNWYFDDDAHDNLIIMGQIAYPLDFHQLMGDGDNREAKFVSNSTGLRIFVNIGDVDITPSRESLSYSKDTKVNIKKIINTITNEISTKIEGQIKEQPTLYKARIKYVQISDQCDSIRFAVESLQKSLKWNDIALFDNIVTESINIKDMSMTLLDKSHYRKKINANTKIDAIHFKSNIKFYVDDLNRGGMSRIKQQMREAYGSQTCYVYKLSSNETVDKCALYDIMGGASKDDVILTSSLPKVQYNRSSGGGSDGLPPVQIQVFNEETGKFEDCTMSVKYENAYYFAESKGYVRIGNRDVEIGNIQSALVFAHDNYSDDVDGMTFYAVKPSVIKNRKLDERGNWFDATHVLQSILNKAVENHKDEIIESCRRVYLSSHHNAGWKDTFQMTKSNNEVKRIIAEYDEYMSKKQVNSNMLHTIRGLSDVFPNVTKINFSNVSLDDDRFSKRFDAAFKKYPMLELLSVPYRQDQKKIAADYIDFVENNNTVNV